jgi:hypothetical protein
MSPATRVDQLAMDEIVVQDTTAEAALEERWKRRNSLTAVRKAYQEADETAKGLLLPLVPDDAEAVRVGRFRVTKSVSKARSVAFDTAGGKVRLRIAEVDSA